MSKFSSLGRDDYLTIAYGVPHQGTLNYLQNQHMEFQNLVNTGYFQASQTFLAGIEESYNQFATSEALLKAQQLTMNHGTQQNAIHHLNTLPEFQLADATMRRWVMTMPLVREMYHANQLDGYSETYVDDQPGCIGEEDANYRALTNGLVSTYLPDQVRSHYAQSMPMENLSLFERVTILSTWRALENIIKTTDDDPTDPFGGLR